VLSAATICGTPAVSAVMVVWYRGVRRIAEGEVVLVTLRDRDGTVLFEGDVS